MQAKKKQKNPVRFEEKKIFFDILNREIFGEVVLWKG